MKQDVFLCQTVFGVKYDDVKAVRTHQRSKKHKASVNFKHKSSTKQYFFPSKNNKDVKAKLQLLNYIRKFFHLV